MLLSCKTIPQMGQLAIEVPAVALDDVKKQTEC